LKRVKRGESLSITEHGTPVATLSPAPVRAGQSKVWQLVQEGKLYWSGGKPTGLKNRIPTRGKPASEMIIEDREDRLR
jgi:antitoxin (DNA-binding transcriptional repressor) of toxin-antitoxin stability system